MNYEQELCEKFDRLWLSAVANVESMLEAHDNAVAIMGCVGTFDEEP